MTLLKTRAGRGTLLGLAYLAITLAMTYPLIFHFGSYVYAGMEDGSMSVWNLWWMKYAVFHLGQSPMSTNYLFYPEGVNLVFHSLPKVLGLVSLPLQFVAGITIAYNTIVVLTFVLTGLATYWLAYYLLGERLPAFLAGAFFAFSPFRWGQRPHLQLLSTMLMPVFILLLLKAKESLAAGGRRPWALFGLAGAVLGVIAYDTEYYSIFLILFTVLFVVFDFPFRLKREDLRRWLRMVLGLALAGAVFAVLYLPMLIAAAHALAASGDYVVYPAGRTVTYAADFLSFFVPNEVSQFLSPLSNQAIDFTDTVYLGWLAIGLGLAGVWFYRRSRRVWLLALTVLGFGALALGPHPIINGVMYNQPAPYLVITKLPLFQAARVPARFGVMTMLALALLAGYGAKALLARLRKVKTGWAAATVPVATALILGLMFVEYKSPPDLTSTDFPSVYADIAASNTPGSVIVLPMGWQAANDLLGMQITFVELYQTEFERPMVDGMVARAPRDTVFRGIYTPVLDYLADPVHLEPSDLDRDPAAIKRFMDRYQVAFIVVQKRYPSIYFDGKLASSPTDFTPEVVARVDDYVTRYLHMDKFADTDQVIAYRRR